MNNVTLTDYEEYLAGTLTKRPEHDRFATTSSIFLAHLTGLVDADLSFVELGTAFELDFLVSEAWTLTSAFGFGSDCVFSRVDGFPAGFRCRRNIESQSDWFAKRGISWHIVVVAQKVQVSFQHQAFIHIVENGKQDSFTVVRIVGHT